MERKNIRIKYIKKYILKNKDYIVYFLGSFFLLWVLVGYAPKTFTKNQKNLSKNTSQQLTPPSINLKPNKTNVELGQEFNLDIFIDPPLSTQEPIAEIEINHTVKSASVVSIKPEAFCKDIMIKNTGTLNFSCVIDTRANKSSRILLARATLRATEVGVASFWIGEGKATLLTPKKITLKPTYSIGNTEKILIYEKGKELSLPAVIYSPTHPLENTSYKNKDLKIEWLPLGDNLSYCLETTDKCQKPTSITGNSLLLTNVDEGSWFFTLLKGDEVLAKRVFNIN